MVAIEQELDRAGVDIAAGPGGGDGGRADHLAQGGVQGRRRRFFDDLLEASLDGAVALEQVHEPAVPVHEHLHLDVPGVADDLLQEQSRVAERLARLGASSVDRRTQLLR